jgi:predicted enzyme related to lactoylglutathione lyase
MNKGHIYFEIQADDPKRATDFYSRVFGWKFSEVKGLLIPYWTIETGGSRGGLLKRPAKTPPPQMEPMLLAARSKLRILTQLRKQY